jgi:hypothetical protein
MSARCGVCERDLSPDGHCRTDECPRFDRTPDSEESEWDWVDRQFERAEAEAARRDDLKDRNDAAEAKLAELMASPKTADSGLCLASFSGLDVCTQPRGHSGNHSGADATWGPP